MTAKELKSLQDRIKFDAPSMAASLEIPYQTYRNYIYGANAIPEAIERKALEIEKADIAFMKELPARVDERVKREFPNGIMSEVWE